MTAAAQRLCLVVVAIAYLHHAVPHLTTLPRVNVDEPWLMERAFELLETGEPRQPMYGLEGAYLLQPGYSYLLAPWFAAFGVGLLQARALGVILGGGVLMALWAIGRRLGGAAVGVVAALLLACDSNFLGGVRNARTDIPALFFVTLALASFLRARATASSRWYGASGLATGAAILCHANSYWVALILLAWHLVDHRRAWWRVRAGYAYAGGLAAALAPYLTVIAVYWDEFRRQLALFAGDRVPGTTTQFIWRQIQREPERYRGWYFGLITNDVPNPLLWTFQALLAAGIVASLFVIVRREAERRERTLMLLLALGSAMIFAAFINNKALVYMPHLLVGFALIAAAAVADGAAWIARPPRAVSSSAVVAAFVVLFGGASIAYYEMWYASALRSELVPYASTEATLRTLVPPGPKALVASPHFWVPYAGDEEVAFYSYANLLPGEGGRLPVGSDRPVYLLVDETQWITDMLPGARESTELWRSRWYDAITNRCAVQSLALGTAYGTMALYECGERITAPHQVRIVGGTDVLTPTETLVDAGPHDLAYWPLYVDPRRSRALPFEGIDVLDDRIVLEGGGWPGIEKYIAVTPGHAYLVTYDIDNARRGDLLYLGRWEHEEVRSLSGASASGIAASLALPDWFPKARAFRAVANQVRVLIYSEAPETSLVVRRLTIRRLQPSGEAAAR